MVKNEEIARASASVHDNPLPALHGIAPQHVERAPNEKATSFGSNKLSAGESVRSTPRVWSGHTPGVLGAGV